MSLKDFRARSTERLQKNRPFAVVELLIVLSIMAANVADFIPLSVTPFLLVFG